jgi:hypothetical protein
MKTLILTALMLAALQIPAISQDIHAELFKNKKRTVIGYAGPAYSYSMDVNAKTAKPSDLPGFISVDGQILQSTLVPIPQGSRRDEKEILTGYMNYELSYYKKKLKQKYENLQSEWVTIKDRLFLVWSFDMPKDYKLVSRQLYFSTVSSGQILDINAPVFKTEQYTKARNLLTRLAASLKTWDKHHVLPDSVVP